MEILPLKNPLEGRPTVFRCFRSLNLPFIFNEAQWGDCCSEVSWLFIERHGTIVLDKVRQKRLWGKAKSKKRVPVYPIEFIPTILEILNKHYKLAKPKRKRVPIPEK